MKPLSNKKMIIHPIPVAVPTSDTRNYAVVTLENGLKAVIVSDSETDKAACALDVHVGHLSDPDDVAGLAHFCEHLLFMGTQKYPAENEYSAYLAQHGGHSNAFTSSDHTNYYFEVAAESLEGALDRFTQFFVSPLFSVSCVDRELLAVDSEHKKNLQSDVWRQHQLDKDLCCATHPFRKFGTGNIETLKRSDIRDVLLDFHSQLYSANIMTVAIVGREPLSVLTQWVKDGFSAVPSKAVSIPTFPSDALTATEFGKLVRVKAVKEMRLLTVTFSFPDMRELYKQRPGEYISHLIGHEGDGSVLALLKRNGWAQSLSAGPSTGGRGFGFFNVAVELTDAGFEAHEDVIIVIFQYFAMMFDAPLEEWVFKECQAINKVHFLFKEKGSPSSYASRLATQLHKFKSEDVISGPYLLETFDKDAIRACFDYLQPHRCRVMLAASSFDASGWSKAKHYGTQYSVKDFSNSLRAKLKDLKPHPELHFPQRNTFIPERFDIVGAKQDKPKTHPRVIQDTSILRLWHKVDDQFMVPRASVYFRIKSPRAYDAARSSVLTRLYTDIVTDDLNEFSYYALVAGLEYQLENTTAGFELSLHGYNDKLASLLEKIAFKLKEFQTPQDRFDRIKQKLRESYLNFDKNAPYKHSIFQIGVVTQEKLFVHKDLLESLDSVSRADLLAFVPQLLSNIHVEALVHGNVSETTAKEYAEILLKRLNAKELPVNDRFASIRTYILPQGKSIIYSSPVPDKENPNSAIEYCVQIGNTTDQALRTRLQLVAQICREPAFDQLRTKEQLGYMVFSGIRRQTSLSSFRIIIQSERSPIYLESRIDAFLNSLETLLVDMTPEEFDKHKKALIVELLETPKNLYQESQPYWHNITSLMYDFEAHIEDAAALESVTLDSVVTFYKQFISTTASTRRKLSAHLISQIERKQKDDDVAKSVLDRSVVYDQESDLTQVKTGFTLSEAARPFMNVEYWN